MAYGTRNRVHGNEAHLLDKLLGFGPERLIQSVPCSDPPQTTSAQSPYLAVLFKFPPDIFFLNSIRATPSACKAHMRAAVLQVYLSNIVHNGPPPRQCPLFQQYLGGSVRRQGRMGC